MSVIGHIFSGIADLLGGGSKGPSVTNVAAPDTPAPQQQAGAKTTTPKAMDPTFLAAAAVPNAAAAPMSGNVPGKSLLGQ